MISGGVESPGKTFPFKRMKAGSEIEKRRSLPSRPDFIPATRTVR